MEVKSVLILSAGFGTRLESLTKISPKPLLYLKGKRHIENILDKLIALGFEKIIINTHHLPEKFEEAFPNSEYRRAKLIFSKEESILDTGGAIKNILKNNIISENEPLLVYNGDILYEGELDKFISYNDLNEPTKLLVLDDCANKNIALQGENIVDLRFKTGAKHEKLAGFAGIFIANQDFLNLCENYTIDKFSTVDIFLELLKNDKALKYELGNSTKWSDIGTYSDYINCQLEDRILNKAYLEALEIDDIKIIEKGASDRKFFRLRTKYKALIACVYKEEKWENCIYATLASWLEERGISVPHIELFCPQNKVIIMQDCSDLDLLELSKEIPEEAILRLYKKCFKELKKLHAIKDLPESICDGFSHELYAWEQDYFRENFVENFCKKTSILDQVELRNLAQELLDTHLALVHRDFQSQNIMLCDKSLYFIDFQGMRKGNKYYDLASIIFDSYTDFSLEFREKLFDVSGYKDREIFYKASCQRLMQALGAYCFLSMKKGKKEYAQYIPKALELLKYCTKKASIKSLIKQLEECETID
ncbi:MAG: sugar phosphate nucleotidyltransferase [Opitutales bacterium]